MGELSISPEDEFWIGADFSRYQQNKSSHLKKLYEENNVPENPEKRMEFLWHGEFGLTEIEREAIAEDFENYGAGIGLRCLENNIIMNLINSPEVE